MRTYVHCLTRRLLLILIVTIPLAMAQSVQAQRGDQPVIHEGKVVEITDTTITVKEWAGSYTYRLRPEGRPALEAAGIRPGDTVSFYAWEANQIAFDFRKR